MYLEKMRLPSSVVISGLLQKRIGIQTWLCDLIHNGWIVSVAEQSLEVLIMCLRRNSMETAQVLSIPIVTHER
jgi:hypothetical protein